MSPNTDDLSALGARLNGRLSDYIKGAGIFVDGGTTAYPLLDALAMQ